ncbi:MAG: hypothetical protein OEY52_14365 [Gammaproteobacteria bacterium]|nr:hypothetical protein [Gammaproteobacteria bacterium]
MYFSRIFAVGILAMFGLVFLTKSLIPDSQPPQTHLMHGLKAVIDPVTGEFIRSPTQVEAHSLPAASLTAQDQTNNPVEEIPPAQPGVGYQINLENRFRPSRQLKPNE